LGEFEERHVCHTDFLAERGVQYDNVKQSAKILYQRMDEHLKRPGERADLDDAIAS
jgi:hypothetical protein